MRVLDEVTDGLTGTAAGDGTGEQTGAAAGGAEAGGGRGRTVFFLGLLLAASGVVSPPVALAAGLAFGLTTEHPFKRESGELAKLLLQISVVALGFGMNLGLVMHAGRSGFLYTALSISCSIAAGLLLGKWLRIGGKASFLITAGTAICGGSAIAAIAPITEANEEEISVAMGTVFALNSVALVAFPAIGAALHMTQTQFGLWAALAIHDTSSVVGAASKYGPQALAIGTTVKLARALWIVPVSLLAAAYMRRASRRQGSGSGKAAPVKMPWFILLFCVASALRTYLPQFGTAYGAANHLGRSGLTATLFLIGTGLSLATLRRIGVRPLVQGVGLWVLVSVASLVAIRLGWISI